MMTVYCLHLDEILGSGICLVAAPSVRAAKELFDAYRNTEEGSHLHNFIVVQADLVNGLVYQGEEAKVFCHHSHAE